MQIDAAMLKIAEETIKLNEIGFALTPNQQFKVELIMMLRHCFQNWALFTDAQMNNLQNIYYYTLNLH